MSWRVFRICCLVISVGSLDASHAADIDFNRDIRPLLSDRCFRCHGPDVTHREADLRLDVEDVAKQTAIVPGEPDESELIARIVADDVDLKMPPPDSGKHLSTDEIDLLRRWITRGAKWQAHWAYVPPRPFPAPAVSDTEWPRNWIDHFILARLEARGVQRSPDADRVTLIRRLSFDLTGLPPTPAEVDRFVDDAHSRAYEQLVDRLLASDRFGERMAMYWLDLVRYADTVGYHGDQDHAITPYRDWVIDAFNRNMSFNQFTREQLAGDLIAERQAAQRNAGEITDLKIASGYNRLLQTSHEGGVQVKEYLTIYQADRIRNLSAVWLGATLGCAQCHDHKYDPYTSRDFYSMGAILADIDDSRTFDGTNALPTKREPELLVLSRSDRVRKAKLQRKIAECVEQKGDANQAIQWAEQIERIQPRRTMITVAVEPREIRLLPRGNWLDDSGPVMAPAVPAFLGQLAVDGRRDDRLDLANWLVSADDSNGIGGLTARVQANRLWYLMLGVGIADVLDDFGAQGQPPSHPELLDRLAVEFRQSGWNIKALLKRIAMSRTYQQSSLVSPRIRELDPYNRLFARQSRYRLPAEMVRDNALAISGLLVEQIGGESVRPYQPAGYYRHLNFPTRRYQHHADQRQWQRGVYMHWQRQFLHPMLRAFDAPSREECTAKRSRSYTPLAALTLLNDPSFVEAARVFAERILRQGGTTRNRVTYAFRRAVSRMPAEEEVRLIEQLVEQHLSQYQEDLAAANQLLEIGEAEASAGLRAAKVAAWTSAARVILNLNEVVTRN